jgi:hypothetical protein
MLPVFVGVRHHSPACARLVKQTIEQVRPAYVLVEGPADFNPRMDELLLGHELPIAVFSHLRTEQRAATSWSPFCDYSPEWVALTAGRAAGAEVRFIDLPAWHPVFEQRSNRYADAEARYEEASKRLCSQFGTESTDALWDAMFEVGPVTDLAERLTAYFDLLRGDAEADLGDQERERYMAAWVRAAMRATQGAEGRPVLVVTGGFHTPAIRALAAQEPSESEQESDANWPQIPDPPDEAVSGSFLVPYSFKRLDSFTGYQSGMPSPGFYQRVWEDGTSKAADTLVREATTRLRERKQAVSTADLIAARTMTDGLAALREHSAPTRSDVFDGLASALIGEALDQPLPWARRTPLLAGAHPVAVEIVAVSRGERAGRLHPDTPAPPLAHEVSALLERLGLEEGSQIKLKLTEPAQLTESRGLHRIRILGIPGTVRTEGPEHGGDPVWSERWEQRPAAAREAALIEAGAYGATLEQAAAAMLQERLSAAVVTPSESAVTWNLSRILFDAVLCGAADETSAQIVSVLDQVVRTAADPGGLGEVLAGCLGLWRHDRVFGMAHSPLLAAVIGAAVERVLWLIEGARDTEPGDRSRLCAVAGVRDAVRHAPEILPVSAEAVAAVARRVAADQGAPVDLRGATFGLGRILGPGGGQCAAAVQDVASPKLLGDWLCGLFAVARAQIRSHDSGTESLLATLDRIVTGMDPHGFLIALPSLRQAFGYFPPREREAIAEQLLELRGVRGYARGLLESAADPLLIARSTALEDTVRRTMRYYGLDTMVASDSTAPLDLEPSASDPSPGPSPNPSPSYSDSADPADLVRWRLILGAAAARCTGSLGDTDADRDAALEWLYGRDEDAARRGIRRGTARERQGSKQQGRERQGGSGPSVVMAVDWLDDVYRLFPRETIERLERDAVEQFGIHEIVTDPAVLERVTPSPALLRAVLRTKHLMNPEILRLARRIVDQVVKELMERIQPEVRRAFTGTRSRMPSRLPLARDFDVRGTLRANLAHYQPEERRVLIERPRFHSRTRKHLEQWQLILLVDQSGSMVGSVIHSAVTAACLWGLPGLKTHLVAFDSSVVDLTSDVIDPVELLMRVQLGGGTDIAKAVDHGAGLVENPRRCIVALITDFYEGGDKYRLVRTVKGLVEQGTIVLGLAALDEDAAPAYDRALAQRLADVGAQVGAMTPGALAEFVAQRLGR